MVMMVPMLAVVSPMPAVSIGWGSGIIRIRIPGIWIVVDVRVAIVPVGIIIEVRRRTVVSARKPKTESLSSRNQHRDLSLRMLRWHQGQSAYR